MIKILYVMHIPWGWIKQRPQFIAEELAKKCEVDVFYRKSNHNKEGENPHLQVGNLRVKGFRNWPLERLKFIPLPLSYRINKWIWNAIGIVIDDYDYVWVTDPILWWAFKDKINHKKTKVIYDCMDDYSAFPYMDEYPEYKLFKENNEKMLIKEADFVFCSAKALQQKLQNRFGIKRIYNIVNNAITNDITTYNNNVDGISLPDNSLVYIGTISEWFDFNNTLRALDEYKNLHVILYGPKRMKRIPMHERLEFRGSTPHVNILSIMDKAKGLFMPFVLNELIESVNPVKLYEYIYSGKPILATRYGESEPFAEYVTLYSNYQEFSAFIRNQVLSDSYVDKKKMQSFALCNTWEARTKQILEIMSTR